jgi:hypothetical protein
MLNTFKLYLKDSKHKTTAVKGKDYTASVILFVRTVLLTLDGGNATVPAMD